MIPIEKVRELILKHELLEKELSSENLDKKKLVDKSKEYSELNEIIKEAKDFIVFKDNKNDLEKIINDKDSDKEMKKLAEEELNQLIKKI